MSPVLLGLAIAALAFVLGLLAGGLATLLLGVHRTLRSELGDR
jgi:hypothetical protein